MELSVYIHFPFCKSKCAYCDFLSFAGREDLFGLYSDALENEIISAAKRFSGHTVKTVFLGGGTPTLPDAAYTRSIIEVLYDNYDIDREVEFTAEANPETVGSDKLRDLRKSGVNRISFGVQSFDDGLLKRINRIHSAETAISSYNMARQAGFDNINLDLMFALPGQTVEDWMRTLETAVSVNPEHMSCYGLTVEAGTPLSRDKTFVPANDETDRAMYRAAKDILNRAGYEHYEISNFAKGGFECRHNTVYWTGGEYAGFGLGAHSYINGVRWNNPESLDGYMNGAEKENIQSLTEGERRFEFVMLGLRMMRGISEDKFLCLFGKNIDYFYGEQLKTLETDRLITRKNGVIALTSWGIDLSNKVFLDFL